jgi:hypothetical protein
MADVVPIVGVLIVFAAAWIPFYDNWRWAFTYFTLVLGRGWALAIVAAVATNYVWLWFSYVSYPHMNSYIFYFGALTAGTLCVRRPDGLAGKSRHRRSRCARAAERERAAALR